MKTVKKTKSILILFVMASLGLYLSACNDNSTTSTTMTDNDYIKSVLSGGNTQGESNVTASENSDLEDGAAVPDNEGGPMVPIDSLKKWGRRVQNVNVNYAITDYGDTVKSVLITRTISGYYVIKGFVGGVLDSISKPYTEVFTRTVSFKRYARTAEPSRNWALYQVSMANGQTTSPQTGTVQIKINKIECYINGSGTANYTFNGPDFTQNIFTTIWFGGSGIPAFNRGDQVRVVVYLNSNQSDTDYVAWHWARNTFGFHRIPFTITSSNSNGDRTYEKTFNIYTNHRLGVFGGYISANTHKSLYDTDPSLFSSTTAGAIYKVVQ